MNLFALFSLIGSVFCYTLGIYCFQLNKKSALNNSFFIFCLAVSVWAFSEFMYRQIMDYNSAKIWFNISSIWILIPLIFLRFTLLLTDNKKKLKSLFFYALSFFSVILYFSVIISGKFSTLDIHRKYWGYTYKPTQEYWFFWIGILFVLSLMGYCLMLMIRYYFSKNSDLNKKLQLKYIFTGFSISTFIGAMELILRGFEMEVPGLASLSTIILVYFCFYAINKFKLFKLNPVTASDRIISQMAESLILCDTEGKIIFVNTSAEELLGYSESELIGNRMDQFIKEKNNKKIDKINTIIQEERIHDELRFSNKRGVSIDIAYSVSKMYNNNKNPLGIVFTAMDITKRKQAENALIESESKFKAIYNCSYDAIMLLTENGYIDCNTRTLELFGISTIEEFKKYHPAGLSPPFQPDGRRSLEAIQKHIGVAYIMGSIHFEWVHKRMNGEEFPAEVLFSAFIFNGKLVLQSTVRDVTMRNQVEKELKISENKFSKAFKNSPDGIVISTIDEGRFIDINDTMLTMFGYTCNEVIGYTSLALNVWSDLSQKKALFKKISDTGTVQNVEVKLRKKSGELFDASISADIIDFIDKKCLLFTARDITESKRIQMTLFLQTEALRMAKEKAEEANKLKSEFLANMSHEIRTPMTAIIGFSEILKQSALPKEQESYVDIILQSGNLLLTIINDILDISKIEAGQIELEHIDINMEHIISDITRIIRKKINEKGIDFNLFYSQEMPVFFKGDPVRIKQVFLNIIDNAIKFTLKGEINVTVTPDPEKNGIHNTIRVSVKDTGVGIPEQKLSIIFDAFVQADGSFTRIFGGSGLGLTITKELVRKMGGEITVLSEEGKGSEFIFTLCLPTEKTTDDDYLITPELTHIEHKRVMILCYKDNLRVIIKQHCEKIKMSVVFCASSANEALGWLDLHSSGVELILCDIAMPEIDGFEFAKMLRSQSKYNHIKLLAITFDLTTEGSDELKQSGFDSFLCKPVLFDELYHVVRELFSTTQKAENL